MRTNNVIAQKAQRKKMYLTVGFLLLLALLQYTCYALRSTASAKPLPVHYDARETRCPPVTSPCIMTTDVSTQMGNKILNYWHLISLAKIHNCTAYLTPKMAEQLLPHFNLRAPILTPEVYFATQWKFVNVQESGSKCRAEFRGDNIFLIGTRIINSLPLSPVLQDALTLKPEVVEKAQRKLRKISTLTGFKTFVSVHVRGGNAMVIDTLHRLLLPDAHFYASAMKRFRSKYGHVAFVVVSDDMDWSKENIDDKNGDVFYEGSDVAIDDFALMANCNHSVIGFSTFAYFAAILAGGDVIYFTKYSYPENAYYRRTKLGAMAPGHWMPIAADLSQLPRFSPSVEKAYDLFRNYCSELFIYFVDVYSVLVVAFSSLFYLPDYFPIF